MNISTKNRSDLKSRFKKNAIPTETDFADLIDAAVNQKEDGLARPQGEPVSIEALPTGSRPALKLYESFSDAGPAWTLSLRDGSGAGARKALALSDGGDNARLSVDAVSGEVKVGALTATGSITASGGLTVPTGQTLRVDGTLTTNGALNASGGLTVPAGQTLKVDGTLTTNGALNASGGLTVPAGQTLKVDGTLTTNGALNASGGLTVPTGQTLKVDGTLTTTGGVNANGGLTVPTGQTLKVDGTLTANGSISAKGGLTVPAGQTLTANGVISANGGLTIAAGQTLTANGAINANGGLTVPVGQTLTANGTLTATGAINANGGITVPAGQTLKADGVIWALGGLAAPMISACGTSGDQDIRIAATGNGAVLLQGGASVQDRLTHLNADGSFYRIGRQVYITVDNSLYIRDSGTASAAFHFDMNNGRLGVGKVGPASALDVNGDIQATGTITANGLLTANGGLSIPSGKPLSFDTLALTSLTAGAVTFRDNFRSVNGLVDISMRAHKTFKNADGSPFKFPVLHVKGVVLTGDVKARDKISCRTLQVTGTLTSTGPVRLGTTRAGVQLSRAGSQYVALPAVTGGIASSTGFTIQAWVYLYSFDSRANVATFGESDYITLGVESDGRVSVGVSVGGTVQRTGGLNVYVSKNTWTHLAATLDSAGNVKVYRDAVLAGNGKLNSPPTSLPGSGHLGTGMDGILSEVSLRTGVQTVTMDSLLGNEPGLVGYWRLNDGGGNKAKDACLNSPHIGDATLINGATFVRALGERITQDGWTSPTRMNGWQPYGGEFNEPGYFKDSCGIVHLRGMVKDGAFNSSGGSSGAVFRLPSGYRPPNRELFMVSSGDIAGMIHVTNDGYVIAVLGQTKWLSLDGITFRAA